MSPTTAISPGRWYGALGQVARLPPLHGTPSTYQCSAPSVVLVVRLRHEFPPCSLSLPACPVIHSPHRDGKCQQHVHALPRYMISSRGSSIAVDVGSPKVHIEVELDEMSLLT